MTNQRGQAVLEFLFILLLSILFSLIILQISGTRLSERWLLIIRELSKEHPTAPPPQIQLR